jgi:tRNA (guanine37-N1)-methyltransferase
MKISIISVFPELYKPFVQTSLIARAQEKGLLTITVDSLLSFCAPKERIDAPIFGPGAGMLLRPEVVERALEARQVDGKAYKIFFSPHGKKLDQDLMKTIAQKSMAAGHLMLVPARYEGMDARVEEEYADLVVSIGDFVLMGGDVPAMMLMEGVVRYVPGVVGRQESVEHDSFSGPFVDYPHYTEPLVWHGKEVPPIVRSGNHGAIEAWRQEKAATITIRAHFDWFRSYPVTQAQIELAQKFVPAHYVALMHGDVVVENKIGTTSVTSIDIHDIARSCATYGIKKYFVVTPLADQQKIVRRFLEFWEVEGPEYNKQRSGAVSLVKLLADFDAVVAAIEASEGKKPLIVATSAKAHEHPNCITYYDQAKVWELGRPVLMVFGTGGGLSTELLDRCDFVLVPVNGLSAFNHLSVRSAAAIILDRWLGLNPKRC